MKKYYGNYLGVIVRSDDPEGRGRVKVYIPHVSATVYNQWNAVPEDKVFNFPGAGDSIDAILDKLKEILPWAEQAAPLVGSMSHGRLNTNTKNSPPSIQAPSNDWPTIQDGNLNNPPLEGSIPPTGNGSGGLLFGTNWDGSPDMTDVGTLPEPHTGSGGANLLDPGLAGVAMSDADANSFFGMSAADAAKAGKTICVVDGNTGNTTQASVVDTGPGHNTGRVEATPLVYRSLGINNQSDISGGNFYFSQDCGSPTTAMTEKPAAMIEKTNPHDGFEDTKNNPTRRANAWALQYAAPAYSNVAKGPFSIPNVGAHVWCFFEAGDPLKPVYFAASYGSSDWAGVQQSGSAYADTKLASRENPPNEGFENDRYRGSFVLNERGGTVEIINTEGRELLSLIGYHGNNIRLGENLSMLAVNNDQKLVLKDQFLTVNNDRNIVVRNHYDLNVYGDILRKVGHITSYYDTYKQIYDIIKKTHDKIALYERKRAPWPPNPYPPRGSDQQTKSGTPAKCPVCCPGEKYQTRICTPDTFDLQGMELSIAPQIEKSPILTPGNSEVKKGTFGSCGIIFDGKCKTCGGSGQSPSSQDGQWEIDQAKQQAAQDMVNDIDKLAELEAKLGPGGSEILTIAKDWTITVGLIVNDLQSMRTDAHGKIIPRGMKVNPEGVYRERIDAPIMEVVPTHPAFPGGNCDFTVANRYNVMTGAGGIFMKSKGVMQLGGVMTNLNGDQILITSANETKVTAGRSFSVNADVISFQPTNAEQVFIDGGLAVARNAIIAGGLHVEGELSVHHITAPVEFQLTKLEAPGGLTKLDVEIGYVIDEGERLPVYGNGIQDTIVVDAHRHYFENIPLTLRKTSNDVRTAAAPNNKSDVNIASAKYTKDPDKYLTDSPDYEV